MILANPFLILIVILLLGSFALEAIADFLNIRSFNPKLPPEFEGLYSPERYQKSLQYARDHVRFGNFSDSLWMVAFFLFLFLGGFGTTDQFARTLSVSLGGSSIVTGLIFAGLLSFLSGLFGLPFAIYSTFVIEERYGFNRMTARTFVLDRVRSLILGILLGAPLFAALIVLFEKLGPQGWIPAWALFSVVQVLIGFLAPVLILPLFNRFDPLPAGELRTEIERYLGTQAFHVQNLYTMDGSKRSTKANAFFTGFGHLRRLVLYDTLISKQSPSELTAVVAHEIGHFKKRHILKFLFLSVVISAGAFFALSLLINNERLFEAFRTGHVSVYASLIFISLLYSPLSRLLSILTNAISRKFEFEADDFAARTYGTPSALASALKKLTIDNLSYLTPHPLKVILDYSHPPVLQRIRRLNAR